MVRRGWAHADLMGMTEADFAFWLQQTLAFDAAEAEARRKAAEKAGGKGSSTRSTARAPR